MARTMDDGLIRTGDGAAQRKLDWSDWSLRFAVLLFAVFVLRVVNVFAFPCNLVGDEAYYWDWGRQLDWGYFSKPPLIAWVMGMAGRLGGNTEYGLRIWAAVFGTGAVLFTFLLGRKLYGARAGFWAAALLAATPGAVLLNLLLTIDAPLLFFWTAALLLFHLFLTGKSFWERAGWAALLCVVLGFGHLAKQMMWFFPVIGVLYLALDGADGRRRLSSPLLWASFLLSYLFLLPTLVWNSRHGWITFLHTEHHFNGNGILSFPKNFGEFVGTQLGAVSPLLLILLFALAVGGLFVWKKLASREKFLVLFSGAPLFCITLLTLRQGINGNWPLAFYPAGVILVAGWAVAPEPLAGFGYAARLCKWLKPALWVAVAMSAIVYLLPGVVSVAHLEGSKMDPYARLRGWRTYADAVQAFRRNMPRQDAPIIVVGHRYYVSELAFYLPGQPRVYHWAKPGSIDSQYEIWGGFESMRGKDVFIVSVDQDGTLPEDLRACLSGSSPKGEVVVDIGHGRKIRAKIYWGGFIGLPVNAASVKSGEIQ